MRDEGGELLKVPCGSDNCQVYKAKKFNVGCLKMIRETGIQTKSEVNDAEFWVAGWTLLIVVCFIGVVLLVYKFIFPDAWPWIRKNIFRRVV